MTDVVSQEEVRSHLRAALGLDVRIESFEPFFGGARKKVFFVRTERPDADIAMYVWKDDNTYFFERAEAGLEGSQTPDAAPRLFRTNTEFLTENGISVPAVLHTGVLDAGYEFAFLERIAGKHYAAFAERASAAERNGVLERIADLVHRLHSFRRDWPGSIPDPRSDAEDPVSMWLRRSAVELDSITRSGVVTAAEGERIEAKVEALFARLGSRKGFRLVHGELDPGHILVREDDHDVFIVDLEGVRYSDVEEEHVFLRHRFSAGDYAVLAADGLDESRVAFYQLVMHVSLVYAGSRLLFGGFSDQRFARRIMESNLARVRQLT